MGDVRVDRVGDTLGSVSLVPAELAGFWVNDARRFQAGGGASGSPDNCRCRLFVGDEGWFEC